ncbi:protein FAF-like, chloroplastic [Rutidosis leptorrhynchoides]|uniref:protein FAF-like, chloroplastic n=1 Tax=Rutidosis leptorrhynchoides TaxID=125765 RepID=UPI003A99DC89
MTEMQGIVSILRSDNPEKTTKVAPLRRTLSTDMSSKSWLAETGMKRVSSSDQIMVDFPHSSSSDSSDEEECDKANEGPKRIDIWTAIMSQKKQDDSGPTYVHPLVKKSARSLSEKSLKVCTESLGSETGSDVFSFASSNANEEKQEQPQPQELQQQQHQPDEDIVAKPATTLLTKKCQQGRSFPPPLPSLAAAHTDSPSLHMNSRRVDGRLVLEAVSVPPQKYFETQRQDGRFLLTLINDEKQQPSLNEFVDVFNVSDEEQVPHNVYYTNNTNGDEDEDEDEDEMEVNVNNKNIGIFKQQRPLNSPTGVINVNKSTVNLKKMSERDNVNINYPTWSHKLNTKLSKLEIVDEEEYEIAPIVQSVPPRPTTGLPPRPPPQTATSVNTYQYFWRTKPSVASVIDPLITQHRPPTKTKDLVVLRGNKADCLIPSFKGCKEPRRSVMMWEPFCIATS